MNFCYPTTLDEFLAETAVGPVYLDVETPGLLQTILRSSQTDRIIGLQWAKGVENMVDCLPKGLLELAVDYELRVDLFVYARILAQCPKLRKLQMLPTADRQHLATCFQMLAQSSVTELYIDWGDCTEFGSAMRTFLTLDRIEKLDLCSEGVDVLDTPIDCTRLVELRLINCWGRPFFIPPSVRKLYLYRCGVHLGEMSRALILSNVSDLTINGHWGPHLGPVVAALLPTRVLDRLCLGCNDECMVAKAGGALLSRVRALELVWTVHEAYRHILRTALTFPDGHIRHLTLGGVDKSELAWLEGVLADPGCTLVGMDIEALVEEDGERCRRLVARFGVLAVVGIFPSEMLRQMLAADFC